ncbi:MAG TPA: Rieske (2Fe-2S) protein, partial [Gaiellaceae bacterium]|nr:Rieske (2Fe-2S) protein [Gaiellaceae bacterium]
DIGSLGDVQRDGRLVASVNGREIGVVSDGNGTLRGIRNRCPHHGGPLCLGHVGERVGGEPGVYALTGRQTLRCPWHGWEFDLQTGLCLDEPSLRTAIYQVRVEGDRVLIQA